MSRVAADMTVVDYLGGSVHGFASTDPIQQTRDVSKPHGILPRAETIRRRPGVHIDAEGMDLEGGMVRLTALPSLDVANALWSQVEPRGKQSDIGTRSREELVRNHAMFGCGDGVQVPGGTRVGPRVLPVQGYVGGGMLDRYPSDELVTRRMFDWCMDRK